MNKGLNNNLKVYAFLNAFYIKYKAKLDLNIMIAAFFVTIELNRGELEILIPQSTGDNSGIAKGKKVDRVRLTNEILKNANTAASCLHNAGNLAMAKKLKITRSALNKMTADELNAFAIMVVSECTLLLTDLVDSGVTALTLAKITTAKNLFYTEKDEPTAKIKSNATINEEIAVLDNTNQVIIRDELKGAMMFYMDSEPVMYSEFLKMTKAPKVGVRKPTGKRAIKFEASVQLLHDLTSEPIMYGVVKFVNVRGSFITDENGMAKAMLPLGAQLGKVVAVDFITQSFVFTQTEAGYSIIIRMIPTGV